MYNNLGFFATLNPLVLYWYSAVLGQCHTAVKYISLVVSKMKSNAHTNAFKRWHTYVIDLGMTRVACALYSKYRSEILYKACLSCFQAPNGPESSKTELLTLGPL